LADDWRDLRIGHEQAVPTLKVGNEFAESVVSD